MDFAGKRIFITGSGREFGRTLAINFAKLGADLLLSARTLDRARATESLVRQTAPQASVHCFAADLNEPGSLDALRGELDRVTDHIDVLVHNAAFWLKHDLAETEDADI